MKTPLLRKPRRAASRITQGGQHDDDIAAERAAAEHAAATATAAVTSAKPAGSTRAAKRSTWAAVDHTADAASQRACSTIDEQSIIAGYGATGAVSASTASAESSRRLNATQPAPLALSLLGGTAVTSTSPSPAWRTTLVTQQILVRHRPKPRLTRMRAIERIEWQLEELLVRDKRRITREHLMTLLRDMPITIADAEYIWSGGTRTDRVLDRCFELMGEDRNDSMHDNRAIGGRR